MRRRPAEQLGLLPGDLLGRLRLLVLVQLLDLFAVLDRVLDQLIDGVEIGVAHGRQLDGRQIEVYSTRFLIRTPSASPCPTRSAAPPTAGPRARNPWPPQTIAPSSSSMVWPQIGVHPADIGGQVAGGSSQAVRQASRRLPPRRRHGAHRRNGLRGGSGRRRRRRRRRPSEAPPTRPARHTIAS